MIKPKPTQGDSSWFVEARFGLFIHWGLYALPARHKWVKSREEILAATAFADSREETAEPAVIKPEGMELLPLEDQIDFLMQVMKKAARDLEFERAARIRDEIKALKEKQKSDRKRVRRLRKG